MDLTHEHTGWSGLRAVDGPWLQQQQQLPLLVHCAQAQSTASVFDLQADRMS